MHLLLLLAMQVGLEPTASPSDALHPVADSAQVYRGDAGELSVGPPRLEAPQISIDGALDEPVWQHTAVLTGFTHYEPVEGTPALDGTRVLVFYASDALYVGVHARDSAPGEIRARLGERDRALMTDDWIRIMLDTFDDQRQAYVFYLTPRGIQGDGIWVEGNDGRGGVPIDFNPDYIWESAARLVADGWSAELRIPYISLRFRADAVQTWGFNVARETRRNGYKTSWAPLTQNRTSTLGQIGKLTNLQGLRPQRLVELNPVATGRRTGQLTESGFEHTGVTPELGINARFGITQNLMVDATVNPDFSQIEADADQITANERFALSVPEKRPFFLDGTEIFRTPQRLVYTRTIVDPIGGAKLTGKVGSFNVGYLGALDERDVMGDEAINLLRVRRDVGGGSTLGALLTDRSTVGSDAHNRVAALDARLLFLGRYSLTAQLARSWTRDSLDATGAGELLYLGLERSGQLFGWEMVLEDVAPDFDAQSGFIRRAGDGRLFGRASLDFQRAPGSLLESWGADLRIERFHHHRDLAGPSIESEIQLEPSLHLRGANSVRFILRRGYYALQPDDYNGYQVSDGAGGLAPMAAPGALESLYAVAFMPHFRPTSWLQVAGRLYLRETPVFVEGSRGFEFLLSPELRLWPTDGLSLEFDYARSRLWRQSDDALFATQDIPRLEVQYQFSRALLARIVAQYNLHTRAPLLDPATGSVVHVDGIASTAVSSGDFGGQLLVSYEPSPGTLFYIGWAQHLRGPRTLRFDEMDRMSDGIFVKLSYLYRL